MGRMAHKAPDYLAINPNGELPAIRHGNRVIYDSQLIAEYLDGIYDSGETLHPNDAWLAAQVRMWLALEAGTHKELRPLFYLHVIRPELLAAGVQADTVEETIPQGVHASHCRWLRDALAGNPRFDTSEELARSIILGKLDFVEKGLSGGEFLVGDRLTMADVAWFTRINILERIGIPLSSDRYPQVLRWYEALARRPSIAATMPCAAT
jgi:glutathione S-transferase